MREFTFGGTNLTVLGATTLNGLKPAAAPSVNIEYLRHWVGQTFSATSLQQRIEFSQQAVAGSPALTGATPAKLKLSDPNASVITSGTALAAGNCGVNASTESTGSNTTIFDDVFNVINGYLNVPTPPETIIFPAGFANAARLWFPTAPTNTSNWTWGQNFREV